VARPFFKVIRVILFGLPGMLGEIAEAALADKPDIALAGRPHSAAALARIVQDGKVDVVIMGSRDRGLPAFGREVLVPEPNVKVLTICDDGRESFLYELRPFQTDLGELSPEGLLDAVRATA
jgi:hypothetical protein